MIVIKYYDLFFLVAVSLFCWHVHLMLPLILRDNFFQRIKPINCFGQFLVGFYDFLLIIYNLSIRHINLIISIWNFLADWEASADLILPSATLKTWRRSLLWIIIIENLLSRRDPSDPATCASPYVPLIKLDFIWFYCPFCKQPTNPNDIFKWPNVPVLHL